MSDHVCPCQTDVDEPGPHIKACPYSDPDHDPDPFGIAELEREKLTDRAPDFEVFVPGIPRPQGSKTPNGNGSMRESSKYVKAWRTAVAVAARAAHLNRVALVGPMMLGVEFLFPRPKKHLRKCPSVHLTLGYAKQCANCHGTWRAVKPDAPVYMASKPDKDKLVRAVGDALVTAGVVLDDSLFVLDHPSGCKRYANPGEQPGARIRIWRVT